MDRNFLDCLKIMTVAMRYASHTVNDVSATSGISSL